MSGIRWICTAILWPDVYFTYFITFPLHFWDYMIRFLQLNLKRTLSRRTIGTLELLSPAHIFGVQHSERKLPQRNGTEWKGSDLCSFVNVYISWTFFSPHWHHWHCRILSEWIEAKKMLQRGWSWRPQRYFELSLLCGNLWQCNAW